MISDFSKSNYTLIDSSPITLDVTDHDLMNLLGDSCGSPLVSCFICQQVIFEGERIAKT